MIAFLWLTFYQFTYDVKRFKKTEAQKMKHILIFGGAGFIGINASKYFLDRGYAVSIFDNLSRVGTQQNISWLKNRHPFDLIKGDIRNYSEVENFIKSYPKTIGILHLAAQVAVTTSVNHPREDFEINALGTFNILEALRKNKSCFSERPLLIYASTNKVYGNLKHLDLYEKEDCYALSKGIKGISENQPLDFHSPYGCSKGAGDQYVLDYARIFDIPTTSFRQSCIYGYRQFGVEDQGWIAWFTIASILGKKITIYGDGKQVRDILFVDDLIQSYHKAFQNPNRVFGKTYNVGGGIHNQLSLLQLVSMLENMLGKKIIYTFEPWRPGDQPIFISDIEKIQGDLIWTPRISPQIGIQKLFRWVQENKEIFNSM